jgi:O-antigen/teichoic acid export membrane protein
MFLGREKIPFAMFNKVVETIRSRKSTLSSIGALVGNQMLGLVLGGVSCVVQAHFIDPKVMGYFSAFGILTQYLCVLHIGWMSALHREYPYWIGKGDPERAKRVVAISEGWVLLVCCGMGLLYLCLILGSLFVGNFRAAAAWATQLIISTLSLYTLFLNCTYRSTNEFVTLSKRCSVTSVVSFLMLPLVALLGFWGLCLRGAVPTILNGVLLHQSRPIHIAPQWDFREFWRMVKFGLAMDISGFMVAVCMPATMASLVFANYGLAVLGLFTFARIAETVVVQFTNSIAFVFIPRINQKMGATESLRHCVRYSVKPMLASFGMAMILILAGSFLCQPLVSILAPKYIDAVPIIRVFLWAGLAPVFTIPSSVLIAAKHTWAIAIANTMAFIVFVTFAGAVVLLQLPALFVSIAYLAGLLTAVLVCLGILLVKLQSAETFSVDLGEMSPMSPSVQLCSDACSVDTTGDNWKPSQL